MLTLRIKTKASPEPQGPCPSHAFLSSLPLYPLLSPTWQPRWPLSRSFPPQGPCSWRPFVQEYPLLHLLSSSSLISSHTSCYVHGKMFPEAPRLGQHPWLFLFKGPIVVKVVNYMLTCASIWSMSIFPTRLYNPWKRQWLRPFCLSLYPQHLA